MRRSRVSSSARVVKAAYCASKDSDDMLSDATVCYWLVGGMMFRNTDLECVQHLAASYKHAV